MASIINNLNPLDIYKAKQEWNAKHSPFHRADFDVRAQTKYVWSRVFLVNNTEGKVQFRLLNLFERIVRVLLGNQFSPKYIADTIFKTADGKLAIQTVFAKINNPVNLKPPGMASGGVQPIPLKENAPLPVCGVDVRPAKTPAALLLEQKQRDEKIAKEKAVAEFYQDLVIWANDASIKGDKVAASQMILDAFDTSAKALNLKNLGLTALPKCLAKLLHLETLILSKNKLTPIDCAVIGKLPNLTILDVSENQLKTIPDDIFLLSKLIGLNWSSNGLEIIPDQLGQKMTKLQAIVFNDNKLSILPNTIGLLTSLEVLLLSKNKLTSLPQTLDSLRHLKVLDVEYNSEMEELPLSLGNIPTLTSLPRAGTKILISLRDAVLASCKTLRLNDLVKIFPNKIKLWLAAGASKIDPKIFDTFSTHEKGVIIDWLLRLEKTRDYRKEQKNLALIACQMLETAATQNDFKESFINQVEANNTNCQDRAAMSFNEIFTSWKIFRLGFDQSTKEKVELLVGASKTIALRRILGKKIAEKEKLLNKELQEGVQVFLYYETVLKAPLKLVTAFNTMAYELIGKCSWIDIEALKEEVNKVYREDLLELPILENVLAKDMAFKELWEPQENLYYEQLEALVDASQEENSKITSQDLNIGSKKIEQEMKEAKAKVVMQWVANSLSTNKAI